MTSPDPNPNRPGAGQQPRESAERTAAPSRGDPRPASRDAATARPGAVRDKDDVSSAPESGGKPDAAPDTAPDAAGSGTGRPQSPAGGRPAPVRDKDDVSSAPESGDKPDAAGS